MIHSGLSPRARRAGHRERWALLADRAGTAGRLDKKTTVITIREPRGGY
jgi:hypothetical protein